MRCRRFALLLAAAALASAQPQSPVVRPLAAAQAKAFDLPAGGAETTLKSLSAQSGLEVVFATETVSGLRTCAVKGTYLPIEAAERMLAGTRLTASQDPRTGAIVVAPAPAKPAPARP